MKRPDPAVLRLAVFAGALIGILIVLIVFRSIFLPLLLGLGIAYILDPAVTWLERRGRSRLFGTVVIALVVVLALTALFVYVIPAMWDQLQRLMERLPEYSRRIRAQLEPWLERLQTRYPEEFAEAQQRALEAARQNLPEVAAATGAWVAGLFGNLLTLFLFLLNLVFVPVFAFYLLVDFPKLKRATAELVPLAYREVVLARVREVDEAVSSFLRGQLTIALILAVINATGLILLRVPMGLLIGVVAGLANMIPYMALVVGLAPALALCWAEHQSWGLLLGVVGLFSGAQLLEGMYLSPRILGRSVNLHPVWVLLAIIAGGSLFGFFGMLIAVPTAAAVQVFVRHWLRTYKASRIYREEGGEHQRSEDV